MLEPHIRKVVQLEPQAQHRLAEILRWFLELQLHWLVEEQMKYLLEHQLNQPLFHLLKYFEHQLLALKIHFSQVILQQEFLQEQEVQVTVVAKDYSKIFPILEEEPVARQMYVKLQHIEIAIPLAQFQQEDLEILLRLQYQLLQETINKSLLFPQLLLDGLMFFLHNMFLIQMLQVHVGQLVGVKSDFQQEHLLGFIQPHKQEHTVLLEPFSTSQLFVWIFEFAALDYCNSWLLLQPPIGVLLEQFLDRMHYRLKQQSFLFEMVRVPVAELQNSYSKNEHLGRRIRLLIDC